MKIDILVQAEPIFGLSYNWQILINELRLLDYRVGVSGSLYYSADADCIDCSEEDMIKSARLIIASRPHMYNKPTVFITGDKSSDLISVQAKANAPVRIYPVEQFAQTLKWVDDMLSYVDITFSYEGNVAVDLWKDKTIKELKEKYTEYVHIRKARIVGNDRLLLMTEYGNEYFETPRLGTQVMSAIKAVADAHLDTMHANKKNICSGCLFNLGKRCVSCGCNIELKTLSGSPCPNGEW